MLTFLKKHSGRRAACTALVPAAGSSSRMGADGENKLFLSLRGVPVLVRTLTALQLSRRVDEIIIAVREKDLEPVSRLCADYAITKCTKVITGGETRAESVLLAAMEAKRSAKLLAVHDGARPLVTPDLIDSVIEAAERYGATAPAVPLKDTVKKIRNGGGTGKTGNNPEKAVRQVDKTLRRENLRAIQTPQVFDADLLKAALQKAVRDHAPITDDCSAVERLGKTVFLTEGEEENIKITTPLDLLFADAVLKKRMRGE